MTDDWVPRLVALDIDGTLLKWVEGAGMTFEEIAPAVGDAVRRARDAGCHVVLASGRSPHGMTPVADLLKLHLDEAEPLWIVASNGAVVFRYPPLEVVMEETFDAAPAVRAILERHPTALVAVEERGVGYRVTNEFPTGELSGEMILTEVEDLVAAPVSRVIIRDPNATADDFVALAAELGLHGTDYVVGWTAWLDLAPVGVSKASGLAHVADQLGVDAADVLAIGDGRNDIEMLEWAGRGVAMGQAVQQVLDVADDVTASVAEDGAAVELGEVLLMALPEVVATERLRLPLWTAADVAAIRGSTRSAWWHPQFPREDDVDAASLWRDGDPWSSRSITREDVAIGSIGFFGPPVPGADGVPEVEVGYGLVEDARGVGYATEALTAVIAAAEAAGVRVRASVRPDNAPSLRVLAKCGFTELRGSSEDGELVMARPAK